MLYLYTSVRPNLLRKKLLLGSFWAGLGISLLVYGGTFLSSFYLNTWGWLIFLTAFSMIITGLFPYKKLKHKDNYPDQLVIDEQNTLHYLGYIYQKIDLDHIKKLSYLDQSHIYGICLETIDHQKYFFPYFNERCYCSLENYLKTKTDLTE